MAAEEAMSAVVEASYRSLTPREQEVMALLAEGMPTKLLATKLGISTRTAEHHRAAVLKKMGARTVSHLARMSMSLQSRNSPIRS
jgi:two-component system response regulator FixJ